MSISKFEAAVLYDYRNRKKAINNHVLYLVLDLDECSFGICSCNEKGETDTVDSYADLENYNLWHACVRQVKNILGNRYLFDVQQEMINQMQMSNHAVESYLRSNRVFDTDMFRFAEYTISCSEFENSIEPVKKKLDALLEAVNKRIPSDKMLQVRIVVLGYAQKLSLVDYYIRERFSAEPFLADDRFRNLLFQEEDAKIVETGMKYHTEKTSVNHTYTIMLLNRQSGITENIRLNKKDQYIGPIYLSKEEMLSIQIDSEMRKIELPDSFLVAEDDLIEAAIGIKDDLPNLFLRRCRFPTQVYTVDLDNH